MLSSFRRQALLSRQGAALSRNTFNGTRQFHKTVTQAYPRKDSQDKDSINTEPTEYSKSGSDSAAAGKDEAFNPSTTRPEEQKPSDKKEPTGSLNASPANTDLGVPSSKKDDSGASPSESKSSQGSRARSSGEDKPNKQGSGPGAAR